MSPRPAPTAKRLIGQTLAGRYRILEPLSAGGMGMLYTARHVWTRREVALKLLQPGLDSSAGVGARFLREAQSAAQLDHPNVVDVLDMGQTEDGLVFMVLEMLAGETLSQRLRRGPMGAAEAIRLLEPIMDALVYVHERQLVHRDIKPANIFLATTPRQGLVPKLLDFGLVKILDDANAGSASRASARSSFDTRATRHVTRQGHFLGSPFYLSPEQARGETGIGPAADVWSMGIVFYEALTGQKPFQTTDPVVAVGTVCSEAPIPIAEVDPQLPPAVCAWIDRALSHDAAARPTMAEFMVGMLETLNAPSDSHEERTTAETGPPAAPPGASPAPTTALAATVVAKRPRPTTELAATVVAKRPARDRPPSRKNEMLKGDTTTLVHARSARRAEPAAERTPEAPAKSRGDSPAQRRRSVLPLAMLGALVVGLGAYAVTRTSTTPEASERAEEATAPTPPALEPSTRASEPTAPTEVSSAPVPVVDAEQAAARVEPSPPPEAVAESTPEAVVESTPGAVAEPTEEPRSRTAGRGGRSQHLARERTRSPMRSASNPLEFGL